MLFDRHFLGRVERAPGWESVAAEIAVKDSRAQQACQTNSRAVIESAATHAEQLQAGTTRAAGIEEIPEGNAPGVEAFMAIHASPGKKAERGHGDIARAAMRTRTVSASAFCADQNRLRDTFEL
jgi:hypothetical protein